MLFLDFEPTKFCAETASIWGVLGWFVFIMKIVVPLGLIIMGMLDLGKAVIASEEKAINKSINTLLHRFIAAIVLFFIPSIVLALFNALTSFDASKDNPNYRKCIRCLLEIQGASKEESGQYCKSTNSIESGSADINPNSQGSSGTNTKQTQ
jgi:preprotein translocase subunit SecG